MEGMDNKENGAVFTQLVKAGKRTYFFDVKATRHGDYYLTVTESKKRFSDDGRFTFEKHKIFVYREDIEKFTDALRDTFDFIQSQPAPENNYQNYQNNRNEANNQAADNNQQPGFTDVSFEDLDQ